MKDQAQNRRDPSTTSCWENDGTRRRMICAICVFQDMKMLQIITTCFAIFTFILLLLIIPL